MSVFNRVSKELVFKAAVSFDTSDYQDPKLMVELIGHHAREH